MTPWCVVLGGGGVVVPCPWFGVVGCFSSSVETLAWQVSTFCPAHVRQFASATWCRRVEAGDPLHSQRESKSETI